MGKITTTFVKYKGTLTLRDTITKMFRGFSEVTLLDNDVYIKGRYTHMLPGKGAFEYLRAIFNNLGLTKANEIPVDNTEIINKAYIEVSGILDGTNKLFIISVYSPDDSEEVKNRLEKVQQISNIYKTTEGLATTTDIFNYDANIRPKGDAIMAIDLSGSMADELESAKAALKNAFLKYMTLYDIDWNVYVIGSTPGQSNYMYNAVKTSAELNIMLRYYTLNVGGSSIWTCLTAAEALYTRKIQPREGASTQVIAITDDIEVGEDSSGNTIAYLDYNNRVKSNLEELLLPRYSILGPYPVYNSGPRLAQYNIAYKKAALELIVDKNNPLTYFEKENVTVNTINPVSSNGGVDREIDLTSFLAIRSKGVMGNIYDYENGYNTVLEAVAKNMSGEASIVKLSKHTVVPATITVFCKGIKLDDKFWRYDERSKSIAFLKLEGTPVKDIVEIKLVYKYKI